MRRALLTGLAALTAYAGANGIFTGVVDGKHVCLEKHPTHTLVSYTEGGYLVAVLDANGSGRLDGPDDRVVVRYRSDSDELIEHVYSLKGVTETRVSVSGETREYFGAHDGRIFPRPIDREGYDAAGARFEQERERLARFEVALEDQQTQMLETCDPFGLYPRPIDSNRDR